MKGSLEDSIGALVICAIGSLGGFTGSVYEAMGGSSGQWMDAVIFAAMWAVIVTFIDRLLRKKTP